MDYSESEIAKFEALLRAKLPVYEAYHQGSRRAQTARARHFVDVVRRVEAPVTQSEHAYLWYLEQQRSRVEENNCSGVLGSIGQEDTNEGPASTRETNCHDCREAIEDDRLRVMSDTNLCGYCAIARSKGVANVNVPLPFKSIEDWKAKIPENWGGYIKQ